MGNDIAASDSFGAVVMSH